jgi:hypothetical protein
MPKDACTKILNYGEANLFQEKIIGVITDAFKTKNNNNYDSQDMEIILIFFEKDFIKQILDKICLGSGKERNKDHTYH